MPDLQKTPASPGASVPGSRSGPRPSPSGGAIAGPGASASGDWPAQATDAIVGVIDSVKDKVNGPATSTARAIVYGTLAALVGTAALVVVLVLLFRGIDIVTQIVLDAADVERAGRSTWIAHLISGLAMLIPGALLWRRGTRAPAS